ncbi:SRP54-domain-containing protein [Atractiella rhizophila]|nr:SRP54-domain-containing protein [Atractiella rhizophila]
MVLSDLGRKISTSLNSLLSNPIIDEKSLDASLKEIASALLTADVNVKLVQRLRTRVKQKVVPLLEELKSGKEGNPAKVRVTVQRALFDELTHLPKKGASNVIMMVGLQGSGKTTTCTKLAVHYQKRGFKSCLVCADTFRAGAFDQLKQNATKARIPFYGSYTELDPVALSAAGVEKFRAEKFDVIILDTSGRHQQEAELFEEMKLIKAAVGPEMTILVLDGAIGQAAESQSKAFKEAAGFGAIIVTKMDGHAKGGGAISAVAATHTPIMFTGTGEHLSDLERFVPGPFISKLLGMGDLQGLMESARDNFSDKQKETMKKVMEKGEFSLRDMREQMMTVMNMGPVSKIASMIPGMSQLFGQEGSEEETTRRMKRLIYIFDSMTDRELDSDGRIFHTPLSKQKLTVYSEGRPRRANRRVLRIARGSGTSVQEVEEVLAQHKMFSEMVKKAGGKKGWLTMAQKMQQGGGMPGAGGRGRGGMPSPQQIAQMQKMIPPGMRQELQKMGPAGIQKMMEQMGAGGMGGMGGFPGMGGMPGMGGGGGGGGMPDMSQVRELLGFL